MPKFSLIYPTRHRPRFVEKALWFLRQQRYADFDVIVSDNYTDSAQSCEAICKEAGLANLRYVRPPVPMNMVEHWNFPLQFATGDYVCYFTDKMFLLPDTLLRTVQCIEAASPDIVNWIDNAYLCARFPDYFGEGTHVEGRSAVPQESSFAMYNPKAALKVKADGNVARPLQDSSTYVRGKICFGAYRAALCHEIVRRTGALFHPTSPDYTSMMLGLSLARSAAELGAAGILHVQTDLSTGGQAAIHDGRVLEYFAELGKLEEVLSSVLVPGLYCSVHNMVSYDYISIKEKFGLGADLDRTNWLIHIGNDLNDPARRWSSAELKAGQRALFEKAIADLPSDLRKRYERTLLQREQSESRQRQALHRRETLRSMLPTRVLGVARRFLSVFRPPLEPQKTRPCRTIEGVLEHP